MNINATLILQSIAMMIFVWFCMKFIWPPLLKAMDERRERIAEGLAASDRADKALAAAKETASEQIGEAREKAGEIVDQANQRHIADSGPGQGRCHYRASTPGDCSRGRYRTGKQPGA